MGTQPTRPAEGWIQDGTTLLYHYYQEEPGMAAHPSLCAKELLVTATVRRRAAELPQGLKARYANDNLSGIAKQAGICKSCSNRYANLKK